MANDSRLVGTKPNIVTPLIVLIVLALLAWAAYYYYKHHQADVAVAPTASPTATVSTTPVAAPTTTMTTAPNGQAVTDITPLLGQPVIADYLGRTVNLSQVMVSTVTGDRTFSVGNGGADQVYALLDPQLNDGGADRQFQIQKGQKLQIDGTLTAMPSVQDIMKQWTLDEATAQKAKTYGLYIAVHQVKQVQ